MNLKKIIYAAAVPLILFLCSAFIFRHYKTAPLPDKMKGVWIATVENIDYPSRPGLSVKEQKQEFVQLLDALKEAGINTIFMQVRPTADTFWPSNLDPWSAYLTSTQGKKPGMFYDPLKFMVAQAHKRGMAFHAWLNPYRVTNIMKVELAEKSFARKHPEIIVEYGGKLYYNPARRESIEHNLKIVKELLNNYHIDGIHFDDYFYPYPVKKNGNDVDFPDAADYAGYKSEGGTMSKEDWRRENVNLLVHQIHDTVKTERPDAAFGISPFGIWRNKSEDVPDGSDTSAFQCYEKLYADTRYWIQNGWVDYIMPQLYWHYGHKTAPYGLLLDWWDKEVQKYGKGKVKLYIGLALYKHSDGDKNWKKGELEKQLEDIEARTTVSGGVFFSARYFLKNKKSEQETIKGFYK